MEPLTEDSCYNDVVKEILESKKKVSVDSITSDIDILTMATSINSQLKYSDEIYSFLLNSKGINGSGIELINGKDSYYEFIDSLRVQIPINIKGSIVCWITVDTTGLLEQIEIVNSNCGEPTYNLIETSFKGLEWKPAIYEGIKVKYRYKEEFFTLAD